ncbi:MAG: LysM peptidoglycan-binding domain-containing protein [Phycisphaerae bacterium]
MPIRKGNPGRSARYVVAPGDTLTRIARVHYGKGSGKVIQAIVRANRRLLADPDRLLPGMELVLPPIDGSSPTLSSRSSRSSEVAAAPGAASGTSQRNTLGTGARGNGHRAFERYQVKQGDRYVSIAREKLGDARRWREIYELNKDKFPDADRIREGVLIRLPTVSVANAASRNR